MEIEKSIAPCEVCGNDAVIENLCELHKNIVNDELCTPFVPEGRGEKIRVYISTTENGRPLIA